MSEERIGFRWWAEAEPDRPAIVDAWGASLTYGELGAEVNRLTHGLRDVAGLHRGDTVACVMSNSIRMLTLYLAAMQSGVYLVNINYHLTAEEIAYIVDDCAAAVVVCSQKSAGQTAAAVAGRVPLFVDGAHPAARPFTDLTDGRRADLPAERPAGSLMLYTSGTTGRPKGVKRPLPEADADAGARTYKWLFDEYGMADACAVWLVSAPLYHSANLTPAAGTLHLGGRLVLMDGWTAEMFLETVARHGVTGTHMVPTQFHRLLRLPEAVREAADVGSLRAVLHGAAPCPRPVKERMLAWFGPVLYEYYGSTEVGTTIARPHEWLARPGTVGRPASISTLKIFDPEGNEVPSGVEGTVYMRQGADVVEYHNDPEKTRHARRDGLLTVGDLGYVDADGYLFLTGRSSDLIIVGGVNVYPAEIEAALLTHPQVADAGVVAAADPDLGEVPVAFVEAVPGPLDGAELRASIAAHCAGKLARVKCPARLHLVTGLPRDPNGKLYKARLSEDAVAVAADGASA
ncbi:long-chain acyl-CoA synthetase [Actinocorallia herbida]|uniref:Long-chain acyl-CoA synthetase n=1 Tax=Actinocorallia herbida TaxID=58109 RepID=A0A3N1CWY3_9ACTN|nr:AMP-binding protein [Actinocorallia herbida]ROO85810.1 long-chain acyl-CoA synthetase [Actinocorallia herbida]